MQPQYHPSLLRQLKTAMSSATMLELLSRNWPYPKQRGFILRDCQVVRVHLRRGNTFVLDYDMVFFDGKEERIQRVFGELIGEQVEQRCGELLGKLTKPTRGQLPRGTPTDLITCVPELGLILRVSGLDEKLHGLNSTLNPVVMRPVVARYLSVDSRKVTRCTVEILNHRLGKRCVIRYRLKILDSETGEMRFHSVIGKVYRFGEERERAVFAAMQALWEQGFSAEAEDGIRVPQPLAYMSDWQLLLMEDASGTSLACLDRPELEPAVESAGRTLAKLHRCAIEVPGQHTAEDELELLNRWVTVLSQVHPEMKALLEEAFAEVGDALNRYRSFEPAVVHRDFYEKQVLLNGHHTTLIDFDTLCRSDPAIDLGNFLAHLKFAGLQRLGNVDRLEGTFLAAYRPVSSEDFFARVETYTKASLLRLACFYALLPQWRHLAEPLLGKTVGQP